MNERPPIPVPNNKFFVKSYRFRGEYSRNYFHPGISKPLKSFTGNVWIWIFDRANNAFDSGIYESFGTRRRLAVMIVRLERNIGRSSTCTIASLL